MRRAPSGIATTRSFGGHEILPRGGHVAARWRPTELPRGGQPVQRQERPRSAQLRERLLVDTQIARLTVDPRRSVHDQFVEPQCGGALGSVEVAVRTRRWEHPSEAEQHRTPNARWVAALPVTRLGEACDLTAEELPELVDFEVDGPGPAVGVPGVGVCRCQRERLWTVTGEEQLVGPDAFGSCRRLESTGCPPPRCGLIVRGSERRLALIVPWATVPR